MPIDIGKEMALPMEQIIGGPLQAIIKAQSLAAFETSSFIQSVGLQVPAAGVAGPTTARNVSFSFNRIQAPKNGEKAQKEETVELAVPLLTIVPVPFIRIEEATIDFECKVSSSTLDTSQHTADVQAEASGGFWGVKFSVKASYSYQSTHKDQVDKSATLKVHVKAVQDEMPAGLREMLNILQTAIKEKITPPKD